MHRRKRLYGFLLIACIAGYAWLLYHLKSGHSEGFAVCLFKRLTGIPCPSCGTTRSILALSEGRFQDAFLSNPLGYVLALMLLIIPLWILSDIVRKKSSLLHIYFKTESIVRRPQLAIPLAAIVLLIWGWNISKGL